MIVLDNVSKRYKGISYNGDSGIYLWIKNIVNLTGNKAASILAVNDISFTVDRGEIFGIYGSNGAGKTTLIKLLSGLLLPSEGVVSVNGRTELKHIKNMVSYISTNGWMGLEWQLTAKENLILYGNMFGGSGRSLENKCDRVLASVGMTEAKDKLISQLSAGMRQKITIARGLILDRPIIFYDEPSVSLDVPSAKELRALIQADTVQNRRTAIIASHNEEDLSICDRIMFLSKGELIAVGTPGELERPLGETVIVNIKCAGFDHESALSAFAGVENIACENVPGERGYRNVKLRVRKESFSLDALIDFFIENNIVMLNMKTQAASLGDMYEYYIGLTERGSTMRLFKEWDSFVMFSRREFIIWTSYKMNALMWVLDTLFTTIIFFMLSLVTRGSDMSFFPYGSNYVTFVVLGLFVHFISYTNLGDAFRRVARIYWGGTMDLYMLSPLSYFTPMMGVMFRGVIDDYPRSFLALLFGWLFFGAVFTWSQPVVLLLVFLLILTSTFGIGMISASSFYLFDFKMENEPVKFIFQDIIIALTAGYYYPITVLPYPLQVLGSFIPHTYALDALRRLMTPGGDITAHVLPLQIAFSGISPITLDIVVLLLMSAVFLPLGWFMYIKGMRERFDYGLDPKKCAAVSSYLCEPETAHAEFMLAKNQYEAITGRGAEKGHLFFQIRQAFPPGEISVEEAQRIGYETAMRWTKGKYQFFVCTHNDKGHLHNHIYYNATAEDSTRKFHNFIGSSFHVRRLSDRVCLEHNLSVIVNPKQHSKGKFKHYGEWLGGEKPPNFQERLRAAIDNVLHEKPEDFDTFLAAMAAAGFEHKWGRGGVLSFRAPDYGQERFTRLRSSTLGDGYGIEDIRAVIEGRAAPLSERRAAPAPRKVNLIIDIQEKMKQGKGTAYAKWATVYNLKQMAAALQYLQENNLLVYEDLAAKAETVSERFHGASDNLKQTETAIKRNAELKAAIADYARTRPIFEEYKAKKYSNKYLTEHEADIAVYRAAQVAMKELLNGEKLPKMDALKAEWLTLTAAKKSGYSDYRAAQKDMREVIAVKANIDYLLGITGRDKNKEMER